MSPEERRRSAWSLVRSNAKEEAAGRRAEAAAAAAAAAAALLEEAELEEEELGVPVPENPMRRWCFNVQRSRWFTAVIVTTILATAVIEAMSSPKLTAENAQWEQTATLSEILFNVIFTIEALIKAFALGCCRTRHARAIGTSAAAAAPRPCIVSAADVHRTTPCATGTRTCARRGTCSTSSSSSSAGW